MRKRHSPISMGIELETYSIDLDDNRICRALHFPRRGSVERGERFTRDWSIGSEYNSRTFTTIREALFLLKTGLRKYTEFRDPNHPDGIYAIFPTGGWTNRFAGAHIHLALGQREMRYEQAKQLAKYVHDHIPFLIVLAASSPVWQETLTPYASARLARGSHKYCRLTHRETLYKHHYREITFNRGNAKKPPTLEIRVCDSSIPEYLAAVLCVCRAIAARWRERRSLLNHSTHANYLEAREEAIRHGVKARLRWSNHKLTVPEYTDLFFRKYKAELDRMDIPDEVLSIFKYLKKGWNQAEVIRHAARKCQAKHRPTWQRRFAKRYAFAIKELLNGNSFEQFSRRLGVRLPNIERTWLGRKEARW